MPYPGRSLAPRKSKLKSIVMHNLAYNSPNDTIRRILKSTFQRSGSKTLYSLFFDHFANPSPSPSSNGTNTLWDKFTDLPQHLIYGVTLDSLYKGDCVPADAQATGE